ncbi:hypothetical protein NPIL_460601 [Nephila pilipes]|uniref:Uncharacterized protein n=1 Tax=Nephila pilipes TaxID=299642 RepID=A0A8X6MIJ9_NEPPI|nr:hypothetical protein NPIL_460601 [Nephila pilipes]
MSKTGLRKIIANVSTPQQHCIKQWACVMLAGHIKSDTVRTRPRKDPQRIGCCKEFVIEMKALEGDGA